MGEPSGQDVTAQGGVGIRGGQTFGVNCPAFRHRLAALGMQREARPGGGAGGDVQHERWLFFGGNSVGSGGVPDPADASAGRCHGRHTVGGGDADEAFTAGLQRVARRRAIVVAAERGTGADPGVFGLPDGDLHRPGGDERAQTVLAVHQRDGGLVSHQKWLSLGVEAARAQPVDVRGEHAHAVRLDPPRLGFHQHMRDDGGVLSRDAGLHKGAGNKVLKLGERDTGFGSGHD